VVLLGLAAQAQATGQIVSRSTVAVVADTQAGTRLADESGRKEASGGTVNAKHLSSDS
jgi:anti-sigma factor ChrR (cupin superfamily)